MVLLAYYEVMHTSYLIVLGSLMMVILYIVIKIYATKNNVKYLQMKSLLMRGDDNSLK